jgi:hypothetical protein
VTGGVTISNNIIILVTILLYSSHPAYLDSATSSARHGVPEKSDQSESMEPCELSIMQNEMAHSPSRSRGPARCRCDTRVSEESPRRRRTGTTAQRVTSGGPGATAVVFTQLGAPPSRLLTSPPSTTRETDRRTNETAAQRLSDQPADEIRRPARGSRGHHRPVGPHRQRDAGLVVRAGRGDGPVALDAAILYYRRE